MYSMGAIENTGNREKKTREEMPRVHSASLSWKYLGHPESRLFRTHQADVPGCISPKHGREIGGRAIFKIKLRGIPTWVMIETIKTDEITQAMLRQRCGGVDCEQIKNVSASERCF